MTPIDISAERARTPGATAAHHLNAAGAALPSAATLETVIDHLKLEATMGGYEATAAVRERLDDVYRLVAELLGASAGEIALVESATVAWRRAIDALRLRAGDRVLASRSSYVSCALQLLALERDVGITVEVLPNGANGAVDLDALVTALERGPAALLTVAHVPTSSGLVEPARELGRLAQESGTTFLLDATQSVGQIPTDVEEIGCDLLVATGRKYIRGPRGTGVLYVRRRLLARLEPSAPDVAGATWTGERTWEMRPDARRFETWETSHALRLGLGNAISEALALGVERIATHLGATGERLRSALRQQPGIEVLDPPAAGAAIVTFTATALDPRALAASLVERGVNVVAVPAAHGRWDLDPRGLSAVVRASAHVYSDDADLEALLASVGELVGTRAVAIPARFDGRPAARQRSRTNPAGANPG